MIFLCLAAFIFSQSPIFRNILKRTHTISDKLVMILFFSGVAIIGTYSGVEVNLGALANTRPVGAIVAGYFGGPLVGTIVGAIAGAHRYSMGGFTALACGLATVAEGLTGGLVRKLARNSEYSVTTAFFAGFAAEVVQFSLVLLIAKPFQQALALEQAIALPMILINSAGVAIFVMIINNARETIKRIGAVQSQKVLNIARRTIPFMRQELTTASARHICEIVCEISTVNGAFLGDRNGLMAYNGHPIDEGRLRQELASYYASPGYRSLSYEDNYHPYYFYCIPLTVENSGFQGVIGLRLRYPKDLDDAFMEFSRELGELLSSQIELYRIQKLEQAVSCAELKALRAQVHPHFLFNTLNTISSFCRTNPEKARNVLLELSHFLRSSLKREEDSAPLREELNLIQSYFSIEKARFGDRLNLTVEVPDHLMDWVIPVFILQPLIENAVQHGISQAPEGGSITLRIVDVEDSIQIEISDTGPGMTTARYAEVTTSWPGIGLRNVNERLRILYGDRHTLTITSTVESGTCIRFSLPKEA